jgi:hypothetical protein
VNFFLRLSLLIAAMRASCSPLNSDEVPPPPSISARAFVNAPLPRFRPFLRAWHVPESTIVFRALFFGLDISRTAAPNRSGIRAMDSSGLGLDAETLRLSALRRPGRAGASGIFFARRALAPWF